MRAKVKKTKNMSALADIRADSGWNENFTIQTDNGEKTVYVNANIVVPDFDNMSVVEVENVKIDADYKKRFLRLYCKRVLLSRFGPVILLTKPKQS